MNGELKLLPRKYQVECANTVVSYVKNGKKRVSVVTPVGSGKTVMSIMIAYGI